jgi:hypothetical protein
MGLQTDITNHTKVTRLKHNALLGKSMDLNSLTCLLVTCVLFQIYTTPTLIQSTCSSSDVTTWHPMTRSQLLKRLKCDSQTENDALPSHGVKPT